MQLKQSGSPAQSLARPCRALNRAGAPEMLLKTSNVPWMPWSVETLYRADIANSMMLTQQRPTVFKVEGMADLRVVAAKRQDSVRGWWMEDNQGPAKRAAQGPGAKSVEIIHARPRHRTRWPRALRLCEIASGTLYLRRLRTGGSITMCVSTLLLPCCWMSTVETACGSPSPSGVLDVTGEASNE